MKQSKKKTLNTRINDTVCWHNSTCCYHLNDWQSVFSLVLFYYAHDKEGAKNIWTNCADALILIFIEVGVFFDIGKAISMAICGGIMVDRKI